MKTRGAIGCVLCALALLMFAPSTRADEQDQATQLTFNQPVRIPSGVVLQPGTYWLKVSKSDPDKYIVRVTDADGSLITTTLAASAERQQVSDNTMLTMAQGAPNEPYTLVKWFYPGRLIGHEFLYSPRTESQLSEERKITIDAFPNPNGVENPNTPY